MFKSLKKILVILLLLLTILPITNVFADSNYSFVINDDANLFTNDEIKQLYKDYDGIADKGNIYVKTAIGENEGSASLKAHNYYESQFGYEKGSIFLIDMENRQVYIYSEGDMYNVITTKKANAITDEVYRYLKNEEYYEGTSKALGLMQRVIDGKLLVSPMQIIMGILIAILLGFILVYYVAIISSLQRKKDTHDDRMSLIKNDLMMTGLSKRFVKTYKVESSSSSGGSSSGGGGSSSSGGGGGHSF